MESYKSDKEDIVIITDSDDPKEPEKKQKNKKSKRKDKKREVTIGTVNSIKETLIIKQKVKIKKQKIKCVINIEQSHRKYGKERKSSILRGRRLLWPSKNFKGEMRIVPMCLRWQCCNERINQCNCSARYLRDKKNSPIIKEENNNTKLLLSPISMSSSHDSSLEVVNSDDSFLFYSSDDDLERLIKRTKKRDKLSNKETVLIQGYSTPTYSIDIEDEKTVIIGDENLSLNSEATMILEASEYGTYSPTLSNWTKESELDYLSSKSNVDSRNQNESFDSSSPGRKDEKPCIQHLKDYKDVHLSYDDINVKQTGRSKLRCDINNDKNILKMYNQQNYSLDIGYTGDTPILQENRNTEGKSVEQFYIQNCIEHAERETKQEISNKYFKQDIDFMNINKIKIENPNNIENIKNEEPFNINNKVKLENSTNGDLLDNIDLIIEGNIKKEKSVYAN